MLHQSWQIKSDKQKLESHDDYDPDLALRIVYLKGESDFCEEAIKIFYKKSGELEDSESDPVFTIGDVVNILNNLKAK